GLCISCQHTQAITSGRGSTFVLCALWRSDPRFPKYPRLPVLVCDGYARIPDHAGSENEKSRTYLTCAMTGAVTWDAGRGQVSSLGVLGLLSADETCCGRPVSFLAHGNRVPPRPTTNLQTNRQWAE